MDVIRINTLELACIVGVLPRERWRQQIVRIDLSLMLDLSHAGRSGRIMQTCDYAQVADELSALLKFHEYKLVEVATEELAAMLFGLHPIVQGVAIQLEKPAALGGRARSCAVHIERRRLDFPASREDTSYGERSVLLETHEAGLYLLSIEPGNSLEPDSEPSLRRLSWLASGELHQGDSRLSATEPIASWNKASIINRSQRTAALFVCITRLDNQLPERAVPSDG
jgi:dihydroneopterin aldolase